MKKNEFKNLIKKVAPVILCLLWFGAIVLGLVLVYKDYQSKIVHSANTSMNLLCASADATDTVDKTSLDVTQYPSANLVDVSKMVNENFTVDENGIYAITRNSGIARFGGTYVFPKPLPAGSYTFSCDFVEYTSNYDVWLSAVVQTSKDESLLFWYNSASGSVTNVRTLTFEAPLLSIQFYAQGADPVGTVSKFKNFMMNAGITAYPYIPPFSSIYQDGYNAGYDVGKTDGKDIGYNDGYNAGYDVGYDTGKYEDKYGIFSKENYEGLGFVENGKTGVTYIDISPTFENGIADFRKVSQFCQSYYPDFDGLYRISFAPLDNIRLRDLRFKITLLDPASYDTNTEFFEYCASVYTKSHRFVMNCSKRPLDNFMVCEITPYDRSNIEEMGWDDTITKIQFTFNNVNDLLFTLTDLTAHTPYEVGYDNGVISGKEIGYDQGYDVGLNDGIEQGQSEDPYGLDDMFFGILDAPFNVIRNALNFEILGINISSFVLFIITALIVVFVIKKIGGK